MVLGSERIWHHVNISSRKRWSPGKTNHGKDKKNTPDKSKLMNVTGIYRKKFKI